MWSVSVGERPRPSDDALPPTDGGVAIALLQQVTIAGSPPAAQATFPAALSVGDGLVIATAYPASAGSITVTDTLQQTFTLVSAQSGVRGLAGIRQAVFVAFDVPAGLDTLTLTTATSTQEDGGPTQIEVYAFEYRGIATLDEQLVGGGLIDSSYDVFVPWDAGSIGTSTPGELVFAYAEGAYGARITAPFMTETNFYGNAVGDLVTDAGASWNVSGTANYDWMLIAASFKGP